ncbi:MAG: hypothetical protein JWP00_257 [Chloroflexi bacterium]|nr:hypothetical protein [Chloroflexota bacterium]
MKQQSNYSPGQRRGRYRSPYKLYFWLGLGLTVALAALLVFLKMPVYLAYIAGVSAVTFGFYGYDKLQAKRGMGRVPEMILHLLAITGGAAGGIAGQWVFHHKIRKQIFHIVLWLSLFAHMAIFVFFYKYLTTFTDLPGGIKALLDIIRPPSPGQ